MTDGLSSLIERPDSWMTPEIAEKYRPVWRDVPLHQALVDAVARGADQPAVVSYSRQGERRELNYRTYDELSRRIAAGLGKRGVTPGRNVAVMLPNRHEFGATIFAIKRQGAIYTGIPITYRHREISYIVGHVRAEVVIVAGQHGATDLIEIVDTVVRESDVVRHVIVLDPGRELPDDPRWETFEDLAAGEPLADEVEVDPTSVCHIGFTSGTTGEPKGVMNTHNALDTVMRGWIAHVGTEALGTPPIALVPSPIGHHSGYLWGVLMMAHLRGTAVFMETWDPATALEIIEAERVTTMLVAPTFVQDLARVAEQRDHRPASLQLIGVAGAPIPRAMVPWASDRLDCFICPSWGMTEWGIGISAFPSMDPDAVRDTDGVAVGTCEVRVVNEAGTPTVSEPGELQMRGPGLFVGYHDRPQYTTEAIDADGWFRTGDVARIAPDGTVVLDGRIKDVVIRGGLNIPVRELEDLIYRHPAVEEVAVVGMPDERLGERACAFVILAEGRSVDLPSMVQFLESQGLSKHYFPERLEVLPQMPKTMSGKIRKVELRTVAETLVANHGGQD